MINVTKSQPAPLCLSEEKAKPNGIYRREEVRERLIKDFNGKCYICEDSDLTNIEIEHFIPHLGKNIDLRFDWNNLFYTCGHCNRIKGTRLDLLNCTNPSHNIIERIKFHINPIPFSEAQISTTSNFVEDTLTLNTVLLLRDIYNYTGKDSNSFDQALNLRKKVVVEIMEFQKYLVDYFYTRGLNEADKDELRAKIRRKLHPESQFTAFKIWIIKNNPKISQEFAQYIPA